MSESKEHTRIHAHARLRESVIAFYFVGVFTGCCTHRYPTLAITLGFCSAVGLSVQWWRLQWLNERERNNRS